MLTEFLPPPDLVIYLRASVETILDRIKLRGREFEQKISSGYLEQLNELYEDWIARYNLCPVLTVPADNLNFVTNHSHLDLIERKILEKLTGKEEVIFTQEEVG